MLQHGAVTPRQDYQAKKDAQKPDNAVAYTVIEVFLNNLEADQIIRLIGSNEVNIKSIASKTQAIITFNPATLIVSIGGELSRVRSAHHAFKRQMDNIKERGAFNEDNFTLMSMDFGDGLKFVPTKGHNSWNIQPAKLDGLFGFGVLRLGGGSQAHTVEDVAMSLLRKLSYLALSKDHGLKMNFTLGKAAFAKSYTSDITMENAGLTPGQLTQLLGSKEISSHHDFEHDEVTLTKLKSALSGLGYRGSSGSKTRVFISHREVFDRKAKEVLWVAKPKDPQMGYNKGQLEMIQVRVNEARTCLVTTHSTSNILDCHMEFTIYQKEPPSIVLGYSARLAHNFRIEEGADTLICTKEDLKDPSARVQISTSYERGDMKVTITKLRESKSLVGTWKISAKSSRLKETINSALSGNGVSSTQLSSDLRSYFLAVTQVRSTFNGISNLEESRKIRAQTLSRKPSCPSSKLNAKAEPFLPSSQSITPRSSSEEGVRADIQAHLKESKAEVTEPTRVYVASASPVPAPASASASPASASPASGFGVPMKQDATAKKAIDFPALKSYVIARQLPLSVSTLQSKLSSPSTTPSSHTRENSNPFSTPKGNFTKQNKGVPPNTPATPSESGSPISKLARSRASSLSIIDDEYDDLFGLTNKPSMPPISPLRMKKKNFDLLSSDDLVREAANEEDDDLICMSPPSYPLNVTDEEEDLLII